MSTSVAKGQLCNVPFPLSPSKKKLLQHYLSALKLQELEALPSLCSVMSDPPRSWQRHPVHCYQIKGINMLAATR